MTERDFEQHLRADLRQLVDGAAPSALRATVLAIPDVVSPTPQRWAPNGWRFPSMNRFAPVALAATAIVVIFIGIGLLVRSPTVGPSPIPGPTDSAAPDSSASPESTEPRAASWTATGNMIEARSDFTATRLQDGMVLVVGGDRGGNAVPRALATAELYDPGSGTWTATGSMLTGRYRHSATLLPDGKVLVAGGNVGSSAQLGSGCCLANAELYDPVTGTWTATGTMIEPRVAHSATLLLDGTVLVAGGDSANLNGTTPGAEVYDPASRSWTATGAMIERGSSRYAHTAVLLPNAKVLMVGGNIGNAAPELFDPISSSWSSLQCAVGIQFALGRCNEPSEWQTAVLLSNGNVLVTGPAGAALYDPVSGSWTATGDMREGERAQTSILLLSGQVLAFAEDTSRRFAELYDPTNGTWIVTASPLDVRGDPTATLLADGRVLVAGGFVGGFELTSLASAELFDPGSGS